ncbi:MAG: group 1 truncated hemoglobin [Streptosporangiales bacterium]|nr:group 1 truncated hemoglobin [Streptosporangiales bacterium]MBO0891591.1 group 1 truncated hemoglobin [Acidothermales bacterium]
MSEHTTQERAPASDYDRVGGAPAIRAVVNRFYELVLGDDRLAPFFAGIDMSRLKRHQAQLISQVMGGPVDYEGQELRAAHADLGIRPSDFAAVVEHLVKALEEAGAPPDVVSHVVDALAASQSDVVTAED